MLYLICRIKLIDCFLWIISYFQVVQSYIDHCLLVALFSNCLHRYYSLQAPALSWPVKHLNFTSLPCWFHQVFNLAFNYRWLLALSVCLIDYETQVYCPLFRLIIVTNIWIMSVPFIEHEPYNLSYHILKHQPYPLFRLIIISKVSISFASSISSSIQAIFLC